MKLLAFASVLCMSAFVSCTVRKNDGKLAMISTEEAKLVVDTIYTKKPDGSIVKTVYRRIVVGNQTGNQRSSASASSEIKFPKSAASDLIDVMDKRNTEPKNYHYAPKPEGEN